MGTKAPEPDCAGCRERDRRIAELEGEVADLRRQVEDLQRRLDESQAAGKRQAAPFRRAEGRPNPKKPGRPKGHPRASRPLPARVDQVIDVPCDDCPDCHVPLTDPVLHRQFQTDLPPVVPIVTRFDVHGGTCPQCGRYHQGRHPLMTSDATGAAANQIGPVALSLAAELKHRLGVPYRKVVDVLDTYFHLRVSHATLVRAERRLAAKGEATFRLLQEALQQAGLVHADETGWRVGRVNAWLWVFCTGTITLYAIAKSRGHEVPEAVLGADFDGILVVDGWSAYDVLECRKGRCTGHVLRRAKALQEGATEEDRSLLEGLVAVLRQGRELAGQREELSEPEWSGRETAWQDAFLTWLLVAGTEGGAEVRKLANHLWGHKDEFMLHVSEPGVPATNNQAERQIRPAVVARKAGGCNKTAAGALVHAVLASLMASLRQQGKRFLDLALPLWRSPEPVAIDLGGLPGVVEGEVKRDWPPLSPETVWPVPLAASG